MYIYIYIYIYLCGRLGRYAPVLVRDTMPRPRLANFLQAVRDSPLWPYPGQSSLALIIEHPSSPGQLSSGGQEAITNRSSLSVAARVLWVAVG